MGLFRSLFGSSSTSKEGGAFPWIQLSSKEQLDEIVENSKTKTQLIFKHSTRCGISRMVLSQFQSLFPETGLNANLYYLDLLAYRETSNFVAEKFKIVHQSPQVIIIKNGVVETHESHGGIISLNFSKYS